jgi:hypothetical protein
MIIIGYFLLLVPFLFIVSFACFVLYDKGGWKEIFYFLGFIGLIAFFAGCMYLGTVLIN